MYRRFYNELLEWKNMKNRKPLLVIGARQVGKTWLIMDFCEKEFDDYLYLNLELQEDVLSVFNDTLDPKMIIKNLEQLLGRTIDPETMIFIDEIQQSERAITSLKYFCEAKEDYRIIGAGSLLGVKLARFESSFPVGKVDIRHMYPMDFEEFLLACDQIPLRDGIRESYDGSKAFPEGIHQKALGLYHDYLIVGGMPEAVSNYIDNNCDVMRMDKRFYENLILAYQADMAKYTTSAAESIKISEVYQSVPKHLSRENPKFKYNEVREHANRRDFKAPLDWLVASGMVISVKKLDEIRIPVNAYQNESSEKIYLSDVGLLASVCHFKPGDLMSDAPNIYKGAVVENYVVQEFLTRGHNLNYYMPSESMEIDLILETDDGVIPVEVKSGRHKRSTSLKNYTEKYKPKYAIRTSELNFGLVNGIKSVPLYAVWCVRG